MNLSLKGKTAVITGASKGIGKGVASALAAEGCDIVICARHKEPLNKTADELRQLGSSVLPVAADLTNEADIKNLVNKTIEAFGTVDILVNNAGTIGSSGSFEDMNTTQWRDVFDLNVFAVVALSRLVIPYMKKQQWGRIINISSENGEQPYPDMMAYSATKGALNNITKSLSKAYGSQNILVNSVSPAFIETPLVDDMMQDQADQKGISKKQAVQEFLENNRPHIELKRAGTIDEIGPVVAFLASDKASFITGANIRIDGGSVATV